MANSCQKYMPHGANENASNLVQIEKEYNEDERLNDVAIVSYQSIVKTENPELHDTQSEIRARPGALRVKPFATLAEIRVDSRSAEPPPTSYPNSTNYGLAKAPYFPQQVLFPDFQSPGHEEFSSQLASNGMWHPPSSFKPESPYKYWPFLNVQSAEVYKKFNTTLNCYLNSGNARIAQLRTSQAFPCEMASPNVKAYSRNSFNPRVPTQSPRATCMPARLLRHSLGTPGIASSVLIPENQSLDSQINASIQVNDVKETGVKQEIDLGVDVLPYNDEDTKPGTSAQVEPNRVTEAISNFHMNHAQQKTRGNLESAAGSNIKDLQLYPPHDLRGKYKCKACDYRTSKSDGVKLHTSIIHTPANEFRCTHCYVKNESIHHLVHHFAKIHQNEKRWQCQKCGRSYRSKTTYLSHINTKCTIIDPYACHKCDFTCVSEETLQKHIVNHLKDVKLPCQYCGKEFKHRTLNTHIAVVHEGEKKFKCQQCHFASGTKGYLKVHYKKTRHDRSFSCPTCNFRSSTSIGLDTHIATHRKQAGHKHVCEQEGCGLVLRNIKSFKKHQKLHSLPKEKLLFCQFDKCKAIFDTQSSLRLHYGRTKHHRPYQCPKCVHRFMKESSLTKHYKVYHEMKADRQQQIAEMNEAAGVSCDKADVDGDEVGHFGMWLGISGFGSEFETIHGSSTVETFVKSESDVGSIARRDADSQMEIPSSPQEKHPERLQSNDFQKEEPKYEILQSKDVFRADSSRVSGAEYGNEVAHPKDLLAPDSTSEISCVPDIDGLLECKIESDTNNISQSNGRNVGNDNILTEIGCLVEIKQEVTLDGESVTDDVIERETIKTEEYMVSDEPDEPFLPSSFVIHK